MKRLIIISSLFLMALYATASSYDCRLYQAFVSGNMEEWKTLIDEMRGDYRSLPTHEKLFQLCVAQYGFVAYNLGAGNKKLAETYLDSAMADVDLLLEKKGAFSSGYALKGALYGLKTALKPMGAVIWGPKSIRYIDKAYSLNPNDPYVLQEKGNVKFHMPVFYGGSKKEALRYYQKAFLAFKQQNNVNCNWMYINVWAWVGICQRDIGDKEGAKKTFRKILAYEPGFKWVKEDLLRDPE